MIKLDGISDIILQMIKPYIIEIYYYHQYSAQQRKQ